MESNLVLDLWDPDLNGNVKMSKLSLTHIQTLFSDMNNGIFKDKCAAPKMLVFFFITA